VTTVSKDFQDQHERAEALIEILLDDFAEVEEYEDDGETYHRPVITVDMMLDALACCGLVLAPGEDAGKAWIDKIERQARSKKTKKTA
jgi:hypothetical protein